MLNVFNLIEWRFDLLIPARSAQFGTFVNPPMATLTRGSAEVEKKPLATPKGLTPSTCLRDVEHAYETKSNLKQLRFDLYFVS